jgi:hypothetical protein
VIAFSKLIDTFSLINFVFLLNVEPIMAMLGKPLEQTYETSHTLIITVAYVVLNH